MSHTYVPTRQQLRDARDALHKLNLGQIPKVVIDQNGEKVEFVQANAGRLAQYIAQMELQINAGCGGTIVPNNGPVGFLF